MPTMTRFPAIALWGVIVEDLARDLWRREPYHADDAGVEGATGLGPRDLARESEADVGHVIGAGMILIDPQHASRFESAGGLFQRFARNSADQGLARVEVP